MDDTFAYVAPVMPRRRLDPFALKVAVGTAVFVAVVGAFGAFVVRHERDAEERAMAPRPASGMLYEPAAASHVGRPGILAEVTRAARGLFAETGSFFEAGPGGIRVAAPGAAVVDGPSASVSVVSVAASDTAWAAAVMDEAGTCRWVVLQASGSARHGEGGVCTADAALAVLEA